MESSNAQGPKANAAQRLNTACTVLLSLALGIYEMPCLVLKNLEMTNCRDKIIPGLINKHTGILEWRSFTRYHTKRLVDGSSIRCL
jgi:hypothetical protein